MISHTECEHPSTSGARAKCRRAHAGGDAHKPARVKIKTGERVSKDEDDDRYGQTPRDKHNECHTCGVERIEYRGTDSFSGMQVWVGEKCKWRVIRSDNFETLP